MKVLHVITGLSTGGAERALYNLLSGGLSMNAANVVISLGDEGGYGERIRAFDVPVHALGMRPSLPSVSAAFSLRRILRQWRPDVIHGWMYHANLVVWIAAKLSSQRPGLAWNVRQSLSGLKHDKRVTRQVIRANCVLSGWVDAIVYNSSLARAQHEACGFAKSKGHVIFNGFDLARLTPSLNHGKKVRQALGIPASAIVVGHVARLHSVKDHARFLRAAARVAARIGDARFVLIGRDVIADAPALSNLVPHGLRNRFHFLGERDDVFELMKTMNVFCQSSLAESFPNVLAEAMATGVPCVATDVGDSAFVVGNTGIMVPPGDELALTRGLVAMLLKSSADRRALGLAGRARIQARFSLDSAVEQYLDLYESLATKRPN